jgi:hypothetical protein
MAQQPRQGPGSKVPPWVSSAAQLFAVLAIPLRLLIFFRWMVRAVRAARGREVDGPEVVDVFLALDDGNLASKYQNDSRATLACRARLPGDERSGILEVMKIRPRRMPHVGAIARWPPF